MLFSLNSKVVLFFTTTFPLLSLSQPTTPTASTTSAYPTPAKAEYGASSFAWTEEEFSETGKKKSLNHADMTVITLRAPGRTRQDPSTVNDTDREDIYVKSWGCGAGQIAAKPVLVSHMGMFRSMSSQDEYSRQDSNSPQVLVPETCFGNYLTDYKTEIPSFRSSSNTSMDGSGSRTGGCVGTVMELDGAMGGMMGEEVCCPEKTQADAADAEVLAVSYEFMGMNGYASGGMRCVYGKPRKGNMRVLPESSSSTGLSRPNTETVKKYSELFAEDPMNAMNTLMSSGVVPKVKDCGCVKKASGARSAERRPNTTETSKMKQSCAKIGRSFIDPGSDGLGGEMGEMMAQMEGMMGEMMEGMGMDMTSDGSVWIDDPNMMMDPDMMGMFGGMMDPNMMNGDGPPPYRSVRMLSGRVVSDAGLLQEAGYPLRRLEEKKYTLSYSPHDALWRSLPRTVKTRAEWDKLSNNEKKVRGNTFRKAVLKEANRRMRESSKKAVFVRSLLKSETSLRKSFKSLRGSKRRLQTLRVQNRWDKAWDRALQSPVSERNLRASKGKKQMRLLRKMRESKQKNVRALQQAKAVKTADGTETKLSSAQCKALKGSRMMERTGQQNRLRMLRRLVMELDAEPSQHVRKLVAALEKGRLERIRRRRVLRQRRNLGASQRKLQISTMGSNSMGSSMMDTRQTPPPRTRAPAAGTSQTVPKPIGMGSMMGNAGDDDDYYGDDDHDDDHDGPILDHGPRNAENPEGVFEGPVGMADCLESDEVLRDSFTPDALKAGMTGRYARAPNLLPCGCDGEKTFTKAPDADPLCRQAMEKLDAFLEGNSTECDRADGDPQRCEGLANDPALAGILGAEVEAGDGGDEDSEAMPIIPVDQNVVREQMKFANPMKPELDIGRGTADPTKQYTVFADAESRPRNKTSGDGQECAFGEGFYVKLGEKASTESKTVPTDFVRLLTVDGLDWRCLSGYNEKLPEEAYALDLLSTLDLVAADDRPSGDGESKVSVTVEENGVEKQYDLKLSHSNWKKMAKKMEDKEEKRMTGVLGDMELFHMQLDGGMMDEAFMMPSVMMRRQLELESRQKTVQDKLRYLQANSMGSSSMMGGMNTKRKANVTTCYRGNLMMPAFPDMTKPSCVRNEAKRTSLPPAINGTVPGRTPVKKVALKNVLSSKLVNVVVLGEAKDLRTGKEITDFSSDLTPDFEDGCLTGVSGLYDVTGENELFPKPLASPKKATKCDKDKVAKEAARIVGAIEAAMNGSMGTSAEYIASQEASDDMRACLDTLELATKKEPVERETMTTDCLTDEPFTCEGEGPWEYCQRDPKHPWCRDPCCNLELQSKLCCAPRAVTIAMMVPKVEERKFGFVCPGAGKDALVGSETFNAVSSLRHDKNLCFEQDDAVFLSQLSSLERTGECCHAIAYGADPYLTMYGVGMEMGEEGKRNSIQLCNTDADCFSGQCLTGSGGSTSSGSSPSAAGSSTSGSSSGSSSSKTASVPPSLKSCFSNATSSSSQDQVNPFFVSEGKKFFCATVHSGNEAHVLGACIKQKFALEGAKMEKAWVRATELLAGAADVNMTEETFGSTLLANAKAKPEFRENTCTGGLNAWEYNPSPWSKCGNDATKCEQGCLRDRKCNWAPEDTDLTDAECAAGPLGLPGDTHFCEAPASDWRRFFQPDRKKVNKCLPIHHALRVLRPSEAYYDFGPGAYYNSWGGGQQNQLPPGAIFAENLTDASCNSILPGSSSRKSGEYEHDPQDMNSWDWRFSSSPPPQKALKECVRPESEAVDKTTCLDQCIGSVNGFQPPKRYRCVANREANGDCPVNYRLEVEYDWENFDPFTGQPQKKRTSCVPQHEGEVPPTLFTSQGSWSKPDVTNEPNMMRLVQPKGMPRDLYWPWDFDYFSAADTRCDFADATRVEVDDGSGECSEPRCWFKSKTEQNCQGSSFTWKSQSNSQLQQQQAWWHHDYKGGAGACLGHYDVWNQVLTPPAVASMRTGCESVGGTFYFPRQFVGGENYDQAKCENKKVCQIDDFTTVPIKSTSSEGMTEADCTAQKRCSGHGMCKGCERDWSNWNSTEGACVKEVDVKTMCMENAGGMFFPLRASDPQGRGKCIDTNIYSMFECQAPSKWLTCSDLEFKQCHRPSWTVKTPMTGVASYLQCLPTYHAPCKRAADCNSAGICEGESMEWIDSTVYAIRDLNKKRSTQTQTTTMGWNKMFSWDSITPVDEYEEHVPHFFTHVCKVPLDWNSNSIDHANPCGADGSLKRVERWEDPFGMGASYFDPLKQERGEYCLDYTVQTQGACTGSGGEWLATREDRTRCEGHKKCEGSTGRGADPRRRGKKECERCSGTLVTANQWRANSWVASEVKNDGGSWKPRQKEVVNTWTSILSPWILQETMMKIADHMKEEELRAELRCHYAMSSELLANTVEICTIDRDQNAWNETSSKQDSRECYAEANCKTGKETSTVLQIPPGTFAGQNDVGRNAKLVQPDMKRQPVVPNNPLERETSRLLTEQPGRRLEELEGELSAFMAGELAEFRRLQNANTPASTTDASCFSKVENSGAKLVGQVTGDCYAITDEDGNAPSAPVDACLQVNSGIKTDDRYSEVAFVERSREKSATTGDYEYRPKPVESGTTASSTGSQVCGKIRPPPNGKMLCPGLVVPSPEGKTADTGSRACPAVSAQLENISTAAQSIGGAQIRGTSLYQPAPVDLSAVNPRLSETSKADTRRLKSKVKVALEVSNSMTCDSIKGNAELIGAFSKGIKNSVSVPGSNTAIDEITCSITPRRLSASAPVRRLASAELGVSYTVMIPSTASDIDATSANLQASMTEGSPASTAFQAALTDSVNAEISSAGMGEAFTVTGTSVEGQPEVELEATYAERRTPEPEEEEDDWMKKYAAYAAVGVGGIVLLSVAVGVGMWMGQRNAEKEAIAAKQRRVVEQEMKNYGTKTSPK